MEYFDFNGYRLAYTVDGDGQQTLGGHGAPVRLDGLCDPTGRVTSPLR
jgi:hypothetical protein